MAKMYPQNISEYMPTDSERIVYAELKNQLPDSFEVFYSVQWSVFEGGHMQKSESDFIISSPDYGFLCLEVKGGSGIRIDNNTWYLNDSEYGERRLNTSPYAQAEKSMYYFKKLYSQTYNIDYSGIYGAGVIFPFYTIGDTQIFSNRNRDCTIDFNDMNNIFEKIKRMFRSWSGSTYGLRVYSRNQHQAFLEIVRKKIAVSAAAGALIKYKERQLSVINRVQDNHIYFLKNIRQFYVRGGAGTGKTWIAMKMAKEEAQKSGNRSLFLCSSPNLAEEVNTHIGSSVHVRDIKTFFSEIADNFTYYDPPIYKGIGQAIKADVPKYDAIFIDEAQDFTEEWAQLIRRLLVDTVNSRLGVFFDDSQILREVSFGDAFDITMPPFLLRENIRNTANIYTWAASQTNLGADIIANPVEGPTPITEIMNDKRQLTYRLESLLKEYLIDEQLPSKSLMLIVDDKNGFLSLYPDGIAKWRFVRNANLDENDVYVASIEEFKGLESDMVIYIHSENATMYENYTAYTRAKYYLIELVRRGL